MTVDKGSRGEIEDRRPGLDRRRRPHRARAGALADQARRRRADHRQDRRAGDDLPCLGRPGSHVGVLPPAWDGRPARRWRRQGCGRQLLGQGTQVARLPLDRIGEGLTPFPFALVFPQDAHERLLIERLDALGVKVERRTELVRFDQQADGVRAVLRRADGSEEICEAAYLAGCDGAAFDREGGAGDRLSRRNLCGHFLRRRRRRVRPGDGR